MPMLFSAVAYKNWNSLIVTAFSPVAKSINYSGILQRDDLAVIHHGVHRARNVADFRRVKIEIVLTLAFRRVLAFEN